MRSKADETFVIVKKGQFSLSLKPKTVKHEQKLLSLPKHFSITINYAREKSLIM